MLNCVVNQQFSTYNSFFYQELLPFSTIVHLEYANLPFNIKFKVFHMYKGLSQLTQYNIQATVNNFFCTKLQFSFEILVIFL